MDGRVSNICVFYRRLIRQGFRRKWGICTLITRNETLFRRILGRLYYVTTGISVAELQRSNAELIGTLSALSILGTQPVTVEIPELRAVLRDCSAEKDCQELGM